MPKMTAVPYLRLRQRLDAFLAQAAHDAVMITLSNGRDRVLISKQEYRSLLDTARLLTTEANAARLHGTVAELEADAARLSAAA